MVTEVKRLQNRLLYPNPERQKAPDERQTKSWELFYSLHAISLSERLRTTGLSFFSRLQGSSLHSWFNYNQPISVKQRNTPLGPLTWPPTYKSRNLLTHAASKHNLLIPAPLQTRLVWLFTTLRNDHYQSHLLYRCWICWRPDLQCHRVKMPGDQSNCSRFK